MKKLTAIAIILVLSAICLLSGCTEEPQMDYKDIIPHTLPSEELRVDSALFANHDGVVKGNFIHFRGYCATNSTLQSQLYCDYRPLKWWPADRDIEVIDGKWEIKVMLGEDGAPPHLPDESSYLLKVWKKGNPSAATGYLDIRHPPYPPSTD
jgi:hypothetical protein